MNAFQFSSEQAKKIERCYFSGQQQSWVMPQTEKCLKQFESLFPKKAESPQQKAIKDMTDQLTAKQYSESTIIVYTGCLRKFFQYFEEIDPKELIDEQAKEYVLFLLREKKISFSRQKQVISAIKFYFEKILRKETKKFYFEIPRSKEKKLPVVLSKSEVKKIIASTQNLKHKAILATIYSAGLRLSEVVNLKITDIDSERKLINVRSRKGKKDRTTLLAEELLILLRKYFRVFKPKLWLFEGQNGGQYSAKSVQKIFYTSLKKAKIDKKASVHTLRHSFATHLLEGGEDLRYIQKILGLQNIKTTEIYNYIAKRGIEKITSPLDNLDVEN